MIEWLYGEGMQHLSLPEGPIQLKSDALDLSLHFPSDLEDSEPVCFLDKTLHLSSKESMVKQRIEEQLSDHLDFMRGYREALIESLNSLKRLRVKLQEAQNCLKEMEGWLEHDEEILKSREHRGELWTSEGIAEAFMAGMYERENN
jgi:hypothetical protein